MKAGRPGRVVPAGRVLRAEGRARSVAGKVRLHGMQINLNIVRWQEAMAKVTRPHPVYSYQLEWKNASTATSK
jgi:hypothetical protein